MGKAALSALSEGRSDASVTTGTAKPRGGVVFVFPGQGSQWQAMGKLLLEESTVFAEAIAECEAALQPLTGWSLISVLRGDEGEDVPSLERVDVVQPALFAMTVGLSALWRSLGVVPKAVVGHSQGEVGAAVVAGALSLEDAAKVVAARSRLVKRLSGKGGMAVVELAVDAVTERLTDWEGKLSIAVVNTPTSTVVSGDTDAIDAIAAQFESEGIYCKKVNVDYASHSAHVDDILDELVAELSSVVAKDTSIPFYSTVSGGILDGTELDGVYWGRNLREPVRLDRALDALGAALPRVGVDPGRAGVGAHWTPRDRSSAEVVLVPAAVRTPVSCWWKGLVQGGGH